LTTEGAVDRSKAEQLMSWSALEREWRPPFAAVRRWGRHLADPYAEVLLLGQNLVFRMLHWLRMI